MAPDLRGVLAGLKACARRSAHRLASERVLESHAFCGNAIEVGRDVKRLTIAPACIPSLLVTEYE